MKDALKIIAIFAVIYVVWNIFWRTTFAISDLLGPGVAVGFVVFVLYWLFWRPERKA